MRETYIVHDGPRLFACQNRLGTTYLALFVDDHEMDEVFLFAPVSEQRFIAIRSGNLPLRTAFSSPVDGMVFKVSFGLYEPSESVVAVRSSELDTSWFPDDDVSLNYPTPTAPALDEDEVASEAINERRTLAAFELDTSSNTTEFPLRNLGEIMTLVQENIDSLGQVVQDKQTTRGAVQKEILEASELSFRDVRAASFAFVVSPVSTDKLFEDDLAVESMRLLLEMIGSGYSEDTLRLSLQNLKGRALAKFRDLLQALEDSESGLAMIVADPEGNKSTSRLSLAGISRSLELVRSSLDDDQRRRFDIDAELVGVNARAFSFELLDGKDGKKYSGRVAREARGKLVGLTIGSRYSARLLEESETIPLTGETRFKYRLETIRDIDS